MPAAPPPPSPAIAHAVRAGAWAEVRTIAAALPRPLPPEVALAAARAVRSMGDPKQALEILRAAIPRSGELAAALRLEAGEASAALGRDPWPFLAPLMERSRPAAPRHAAAARLRASWETLPLETLRRVPRASLPKRLRRDLAAVIAVRAGDRAAALRILAERLGDQAALRAAQWLAGTPDLGPKEGVAVGEALLTGGAWREADTLLTALPRPIEPGLGWRWAFFCGRAAYRLGDLARAAAAFDEALRLAPSDAERFAAAVQRARTSELCGDFPAAMALWDAARSAAPREVEGWDGGARARAVLGRGDEAVALIAQCPPEARQTAGPRLAATFLARGDVLRARRVLGLLPERMPVVRVLSVALSIRVGNVRDARSLAAAVVADPRAGEWRDAALELLPGSTLSAETALPTRDPARLARVASVSGAAAARAALAAALGADGEWAPLLSDEPLEPQPWSGPAQRLAATGMEHDAAVLFPSTFPFRSPAETAESAASLAAWGNRPAALSAGERLWERLERPPTALIPDPLLRRILPAPLVEGCRRAAVDAGASAPWLVGIIRQESRFDDGEYSQAGAIGIAQFVPEAARRLGATPADLKDEDTALRLAACEVARLGGHFGPRLALVAAAYNAGENVVVSWLTQLGDPTDDVLFAAAVPYRETAEYVLAVREGAGLARFLAREQEGAEPPQPIIRDMRGSTVTVGAPRAGGSGS